MKFKVGDLVRVRSDLVVGRKYGSDVFISCMEEYKGKIYSIESIYEKIKKYELNGLGYCWTDGMLEKANPNDFIKQFLDDNKEVFKNFDVKFTVKPRSQILDEAEKRYLSNVIRPFRDKVVSITKRGNPYGLKYECIIISIRSIVPDIRKEDIVFPYFKLNTMYIGMKVGKAYTLEELGL